MILGFDISTSCIGWCLLKDDGSFYRIGHIDLKKEKDFFNKCTIFNRFVVNNFIDDRVSIKNVWVEEPVKMFQSNASMAQTITKLQRFNATCCWLIYSYFRIKPNLIMASSARKQAGIKVPRGSDTKNFILSSVQNFGIIPEEEWEYKKTGKPKDWCYDKADAFVVALAGCKNEQ